MKTYSIHLIILHILPTLPRSVSQRLFRKCEFQFIPVELCLWQNPEYGEISGKFNLSRCVLRLSVYLFLLIPDLFRIGRVPAIYNRRIRRSVGRNGTARLRATCSWKFTASASAYWFFLRLICRSTTSPGTT